MRPTEVLYQQGQSLWLDYMTRELVASGGLDRYINDFSVTGLTSNPSIFERAFKSGEYDVAISERWRTGNSAETDVEALFFNLAVEDLVRAAKAFMPIHARTNGLDGWVSLEVSPLLAHDSAQTLAAAMALSASAAQPNLFIKIPGTTQGLAAIEDATFAGVPINVTLLFSREQYLAAAEAYMRGVERRVKADLNPKVASVASVFISRWDVAAAKKELSEPLKNQLGIAIGRRTYVAYKNLLASARWRRLENLGAMPQRLLWASTGTKDPNASDLLYVKALAAPLTINTLPEETLTALAEHGGETPALMPDDGGDSEAVLAMFANNGFDVIQLAERLQEEGAAAFVKSWRDLLAGIKEKTSASSHPGPYEATTSSRGRDAMAGDHP